MNNDIIEGNWKQLMGAIQESYGIAREEAKKQVEDWEMSHKNTTEKLSRKG